MPFTFGVGIFNSLSKDAALSRARPITERQSGRFGVISNSTTSSLSISASLMSIPSVKFTASSRSFRIKMPFSIAVGISCVVRPSSAIEQSIPFDSTPRSLPALITISPGSLAGAFATGTTAPSNTFCAPVTI